MDPSPPAIEVRGDEATIEAGFLAEKLGLSVDRLRAEMRAGIVYGVVERGVGEDARRLRLTFRYRARSWTVVVETDGTLHEAAGPER
jgi:IS4 transposase